MAERRKGKKRKEDGFSEKKDAKPLKEEYSVAKWLRKNIPTKKTKFLNHNVEYFTACKAVDALMNSHWAKAKEGEDTLFSSRQDVVNFLDRMLRNKFFHRAKKIPVSEQELKAKLKKKDKDKKKEPEEKKKDEEKKEEKKKEEGESSHAEGEKKEDDKKDEKDKKKRKIRLEMHLEQLFVDGLDAYVWIYEPIPVYYWFFGSLLVIGSIAICLFPLWPSSVRKGVYYLSIAAAGFLIFIIALAVLRVVVFCLLWAVTFGKHHLWLFPNLTEDVGFLASFWPLWKYEYKGVDPSEDKKSKKKKKDKDSDNEEEKEIEQYSEKDECKEPDSKRVAVEEQEPSESESESSQKSQTGKDFEMVEKEEVES